MNTSNYSTLNQLIELNEMSSVSAADKATKQIVTENVSTQLLSKAFKAICLDSRQVEQDDLFVLFASHSGDVQRSAEYLAKVVEKTSFVISEIASAELIKVNDSLKAYQEKIVYLPNIRHCLGSLIASYNQRLEEKTLPTVVAVTGTNGKTTISQLVAQLTQNSQIESAIMGTAGNGKLGQLQQATHTTGDVLAVQNFLYQMASAEVALLALEASSHGLYQHRLQGVPIKVAIYTNLSRDHLDYHSDMDDYAKAKARLFDKNYFSELTHAIINLDDDYADIMLETAKNSGIENIWTYSLDASKPATFVANSIKPSLAGVEIDIAIDASVATYNKLSVNSPLLGMFNVANLLAAIAAAMALSIEADDIAELVKQLTGADGRMDRVASAEGCFIVDYAHTPDALTQVLKSLKAHCDGELWAVFGCGGDRDKGKRPLMAQAGLADADRVILTADNPRSEDPQDILEDMQAGMTVEQYQRTHIEANRKTAIEYVVKQAKANDIVVIAGKGHETYQEIQGVRYDFDDRVVLQKALESV